MAYRTISEVSKEQHISPRMLRYYEQMGLIQSMHRENYAYRVYDEDTVRRIRQIILLRKLRIPLKKIKGILDGDRAAATALLQEHLLEVRQNIALLQLIEKALHSLALQRESGDDWLPEAVSALAGSLPLEKHHLAAASPLILSEKEQHIRMILLPPLWVASYQETSESPEESVGNVMDQFICHERLYEKKPDARLFGISPSSGDHNDLHTYANWVSIPENLCVPSSFSKKYFAGGLYAAYTIDFPDFHEWEFLKAWAERHPRYQIDHVGQFLEEHLNWVYASHKGWPPDGIDGKIDLLLPIQPR
ncbi:MAG: MerR family transcriptional regulator [Lachnospiraceae bacterium]|jgi:DNA-binding transcriptional MerR regulator|nr:MerR family transcriptional regulator [Lachnospiraceae bacterium]